MTGAGPHRRAELPPAARAAVAAVDADPRDPVKFLVTGGFGTGKTTVLAALRATFRSAGRPVVSRPGADPETAIVIDDAHLLGDTDLAALTDLAADPGVTLVVATQPRVHHAQLRALSVALQRESPPVALGPLPPAEIGRVATAALGAPAGPDLVRLLVSATAGLPFLLHAALAATGEGANGVRRAARFGLIDRLRRIDGELLDTLLVSSLSLDLGPDDIAAALTMPPDAALAAVDRARASGLLEPAHPEGFLHTVHDAVAQIVGAARHHDIEVAVLSSQLELSTLTAELALRLAEHGLRDDRLAGALTEFAARHHTQRMRAARLYRAAGEAGAEALSSHLADALAQTGDVATARRIADELLGAPDPDRRAAAVRIAASLAMQDGSSGQAEDLFRWLGPTPDAVVGAAATITALAAGDAAGARAALDAPSSGPPTSVARAARSITAGLVMTLDQPYPAAVARLSQSLVADHRLFGAFPDTPAALVALVALHGGDPVRARSVLGRALQGTDADVEDAATARHRLLLGWALMQDGQLQAASGTVGPTPHRRDALWAAALQTAVARRSGDSGALQQHWYTAMEVLAEYSIDLFTLLPLGELWVAAARLRQVDRLQHVLDEAFALLDRLEDPVLWAVPLHWAGVHAGILANAPDAVAPHGQALTAASPHAPFARTLAGAGRTWLRVLADHVDAAEVATAARGLAQVGHTWDATRLAGQAALQTADPRVSQAMLQLARDLKQTVNGTEPPTAGPAGTPVAAPQTPARGPAALSEREREVAELLLQGLPYRDIGAQLFISAKTVEHHVARIRRRLGAESRSELLSMLRTMFTPEGSTRPG
ncbi:helix-turn-helix transcriptional regulator [Mycolicibacterium duvalii]|uniref:LuxR family transcriptional regulator n=1 Tax=Mycolicibacterium duvalii TaxID=39688 RepID=A0A7I7K4E6_9MYCO|nr:isoniazid response ATPase/transcriptional regulator IniR [Mycolicibacterium duvalii]MCV7369040.1 helix-turn-helix transcriptional regulator [Mycolicibacterium duvalii]PEG35224.1 helix-turn-helix transcriptional regulator [Mycolicibacterium duvalii]BBX19060.1 LuxR family transcriptional regulator [Mycolicibacterium duvalii]